MSGFIFGDKLRFIFPGLFNFFSGWFAGIVMGCDRMLVEQFIRNRYCFS